MSGHGSAPALELRDVTVRYGDTTAVESVTLTVHAGERVALVGPSGAGKSTLLRVASGLAAPAAGTVRVHGVDLSAARPAQLRQVRSRIGVVAQHLDLVGPLRVVHNVNAGRLGQWSSGRALWSLVRPQELAQVRELLALLDLPDVALRRTDRLSGGQQQRVAVARVLHQRPDLVLADEPVSALDPVRAGTALGLLTGDPGRAVVASLHDLALARACCDRVVGLAAGRVMLDAPVADLGDAEMAALFGAVVR